MSKAQDNWTNTAEVFLTLQSLHTFRFSLSILIYPIFHYFSAGKLSTHTMTCIISAALLPHVLDGADQSMDQLALVPGFLQQGKRCWNPVYISMITAPCLTEKYTPNRGFSPPNPTKKESCPLGETSGIRL